MWCVKCRTHTETENLGAKVSKNNRPMATGVCKVCHTRKQQFVKMQKADIVEEGDCNGDSLSLI